MLATLSLKPAACRPRVARRTVVVQAQAAPRDFQCPLLQEQVRQRPWRPDGRAGHRGGRRDERRSPGQAHCRGAGRGRWEPSRPRRSALTAAPPARCAAAREEKKPCLSTPLHSHHPAALTLLLNCRLRARARPAACTRAAPCPRRAATARARPAAPWPWLRARWVWRVPSGTAHPHVQAGRRRACPSGRASARSLAELLLQSPDMNPPCRTPHLPAVRAPQPPPEQRVR